MQSEAGKKKTLLTGRRIFVFTAVIIIICGITAYFSVIKDGRLRTLISVKKIDDMELYTMHYYYDYDFDEYLKKGSSTLEELNLFLKKNISSNLSLGIGETNPKACSAFSALNEKGESIYGRNLDLPGMHPALLLYTYPKDGYSSVSMVELITLGYEYNTKLTSHVGLIPSIENRNALLQAPYVPRDGMNSAGLVVATLDVPYQLPEFDMNKVNIGRWQALRLMLDHAENVEEAVELMKKYNSFDGRVHFFIADKSGNSAVLECYNGKMHITQNDDKFMAATNFIICDPEKTGGGHDRYETIKKTLTMNDGRINEQTAMELLKSVAQSTAWSVVYNQESGSIMIALGEDYNNIKSFNFDMKK